MEWVQTISKAIDYIENHLTEEISMEDISREVHISPFYFQKGFNLLCGVTVSKYIRLRRLTLAAGELISGDSKVIDIAFKYGYDSPDSFTKAFTRFHGITPAMAQKSSVTLKSFAPLKIKLSLKGGYLMDYKIIHKDSFTVIGAVKTFQYDNAFKEVPAFWKEHHASKNGKIVCGMYGINHDESMAGDKFEYLIADHYEPGMTVPKGLVTKVIPEHTWAVFPCTGAMPKVLQDLNHKIFSEWLPACKEYEIAAGYCIERYDDPTKYPNATQDDHYYSEMWIPVKKVR